MHRIFGLLLIGSLLSACATRTESLAIDASLWEAAQRIEKDSKTTQNTVFNFISPDSEAIKQAFDDYQATGRAPIIEGSGFLQFPFGETEPVIYCQPLRACNITLQAGEKITGVWVGDSARWQFIQAHSGEGATATPHVIFKPIDYDLSTNVIITTNKRAYHLGLLSKEDAYVRQVRFYYPQDIQALQETNIASELSSMSPQISLEALDFNYVLKTKNKRSNQARWRPVRVFNDGTRVFIQMPPGLKTTDAPVLFIASRDGQKALANYRVRGDYYIVDTLFHEATLVAGVGRHQEYIRIQHHQPKR